MSKNGKKKRISFNPIAKMLKHGLFQFRIIPNKKKYNRKKKKYEME